MLDKMRKNANSWVMIFLFAIITIVFAINFGPWAGQMGGELPFAATVNGRVISTAQFQNAYANRFNFMKSFRPGYNPEQAKADNLKGSVLDQLIGQELLAQVAQTHGVDISDDEVVDTIKERYFGADRPFDREEYARLVNGIYQTTEARFEEQIRRQIMAEKMEMLLSDNEHVSPAEVKASFDSRFNRANVLFLRIDPLHFKSEDAKPDDAAKTDWANANAVAIEAHYNKHVNRYRQSKQVKARHILAKVTQDAPEADKQAAREKIEAAKKRVTEGGEDFGAVAKEISEDGSAAKGGDLGFFGVGAMVKPFEDAAFAMEKGALSDIVESRFGYHLIKVEDTKPPSVREIAEVKVEIAGELMLEAARKEKAKAMASAALEELKAGKKMEELTLPGLILKLPDETGKPPAPNPEESPFSPRVEATGLFAKTTRYVPRVGVSPELVEKIFGLTTEKPLLEEVVEVSGRSFVVQLKERELPDAAKFEAEKDGVRASLLGQRKATVVQEFIETVRADTDVQVNQAVVGYPQS
jgi:peptidyl-prolyl cis-trans isomerase D